MQAESHSGWVPYRLGPIQAWSHTGWVPFRLGPMQAGSHTGWVPCRLSPIQAWSHAGWVPYRLGPMQAESHSGWVPFRLGPMQAGSHSGLVPCRLGPIQAGSHSGLVPYRLYAGMGPTGRRNLAAGYLNPSGCGIINVYYEYILSPTPLTGRIQDLWKGGGGRSGYCERRRRVSFWRVPFEDPLWNFKRGGARPLRPPPPESASDIYMTLPIIIYLPII